MKVAGKRIVLITSGQPSINPRLVKEADALADAGYHVTVIYQYWNDWATGLDKELLAGKRWKAVRVGGTPKNQKLIYFITRAVQKTGTLLSKYFGFEYGIAERAVGRCTRLLYRKALEHPADLYIAHNLAALPAAVKVAKKTKAKCGFDAEDFHRNEVSDDPEHVDVKLKSYIENKYFRQLDYLSTASPLISKAYQNLFLYLKPLTLLNVFPKTNQLEYSVFDHKPLKLFWFSQTIGLNRGIQDVIYALKLIEKENVELHLLGNISSDVKNHFTKIIEELNFDQKFQITYHEPISPDSVIKFSSEFDIGLALEPGFSINNNIALSNKIFTYINAGLAIIASSTLAQLDFFKKNSDVGSVYKKGDPESFAELLQGFLSNPNTLNEAKKTSYTLGQNVLNWENESKKFISMIEKVVS